MERAPFRRFSAESLILWFSFISNRARLSLGSCKLSEEEFREQYKLLEPFKKTGIIEYLSWLLYHEWPYYLLDLLDDVIGFLNSNRNNNEASELLQNCLLAAEIDFLLVLVGGSHYPHEFFPVRNTKVLRDILEEVNDYFDTFQKIKIVDDDGLMDVLQCCELVDSMLKRGFDAYISTRLGLHPDWWSTRLSRLITRVKFVERVYALDEKRLEIIAEVQTELETVISDLKDLRFESFRAKESPEWQLNFVLDEEAPKPPPTLGFQTATEIHNLFGLTCRIGTFRQALLRWKEPSTNGKAWRETGDGGSKAKYCFRADHPDVRAVIEKFRTDSDKRL